MPLILTIITAPIIYFGLGWIISSIYYSICPIEGTATLREIISTSMFIYGCVAGVYNLLMGLHGSYSETDENIAGYLGLGIPIVSWILCGKLLPISLGATVLSYILCLGSMLYFGYRGWDKIL